MLEQNLQDIITGRSTEHDMEYSGIGRNGKAGMDILPRGQVVNDADGKPEFLIGRITDIGKKSKIDGVTGLYREPFPEEPASENV